MMVYKFSADNVLRADDLNSAFDGKLDKKEIVSMYKGMLVDLYDKPKLTKYEQLRVREINYIISYLLLSEVADDIGGN